MKMSFTDKFIFMQIKPSSYERFRTRTRSEAEAKVISEMASFYCTRWGEGMETNEDHCLIGLGDKVELFNIIMKSVSVFSQ